MNLISPKLHIFKKGEYFHKSIHMLGFNKYFCKNKKSKLYFGDCVAVLNDSQNNACFAS
jgi:hypothetical protein